MKLDLKFSENAQVLDMKFKDVNVLHNGQNGATFTPSVSIDGIISWTNDKELENPTPINIKGDKGDKGDAGTAGQNGVSVTKTEINDKGELVITLSDNTVSNLGVVVGAKGDKGDQGEQGIQGIQGIPGEKGEKGDTGAPGADGVKGDKGDKGDTGATGAQGEPGKDGADGKDGTSATHSWNGTVLTITSASGTSSADLKGEKGDKGDTGEQGIQGEKGDKGDTGEQGVRGADGHTPQYGVDYGTPEQIADIANQTYDILADDIQKMLDGKVDKVEGMGLSSNDYDNVAKVKVDAIPEDAKYTDTVYDDTEVKQSISQIKDDISDKFDYKNPQELTEAQQSAIQSAIGIRSVEGVLF